MANPKITITSDGTFGGSRVITEDGYDLSNYVTHATWWIGPDGAKAKLEMFMVGGEVDAELVDLIVHTNETNDG